MRKIFVIVLAALLLQGCATQEGGAILGGLVGGVIGNRFGQGNGQVLATGIGATIGAIAGQNASDPPMTTGRRVVRRPVSNAAAYTQQARQVAGYEVQGQGMQYDACFPYRSDPGLYEACRKGATRKAIADREEALRQARQYGEARY